jgi:DNA-binding NarL/FixJ family response regulator
MTGVIVCHGSAGVRDRIVTAAHGVPSLAPARAAATAEELVALVRRTSPALVLLDAHLPGVGPIEALRRMRALGNDTTVIMLAGAGDEITLDRAIALGAAVPQQSRGSAAPRPVAPAPRTDSRRGAAPGELTRRELEVLSGMSHGRSNAQIGAELFLSEDTVKTHARRLFRKLGAADRAQAVAIGLRAGLIS